MNKELSEKAKNCKNGEEAKPIDERENAELTDEEMREVAGGVINNTETNPWGLGLGRKGK